MTSLERTVEGVYGDSRDPTYNAISYTWGRFATNHGPALKVNGITWSIPSIKPNHFSVGAFHEILKKAAGTNGLVWVDIACIDQENIDIKMDEIGKQADIFSQASQVYIWLSSQDVAEASTSLQALQDLSMRVEQIEIRESSFEFNDVAFLQHIIPASSNLHGHLLSLFSDPWFSSLWTLQEACLCDEAHFLAKDAQVLMIQNREVLEKRAAALDDPVLDCQQIKMALSAYAETSQAIQDLITLIDRSGLSYFHQGFNTDRNSMLLYSAANHRTCSEPLDRIYGIMQVYGFKLGASSKPGGRFTLAELEDQFGEALNRTAPMTAQTHVHTISPTLGSAWRPSSSSMMPEIYYMSRRYITMCAITFTNGRPFFKGKSCPLDTLQSFWLQGNALNESLYHRLDDGIWQHYLISIHLDAVPQKDTQQSSLTTLPQFDNSRAPARSCPCTSCAQRPEEQKDDGLAMFLAASLPGPIADYSVLLLGSGTITRFTRFSEDGEQRGSRSYTVAIRSGILVVKPDSTVKAWRRVGIVSWETGRGHLEPVHEALWEDFEGDIC
ncbi:MAG: hypothetical protein L6R38_004968 [Xanthoria sp. 2 TBL-2021]|nr:MAG: hypothetical protein L6R38_004968 [Xanthoria sp. 2 TBL-2021]